VTAYNFAKRLKTLKGLTPYEFICKRWTTEPGRFLLNPLQQMPGLNTKSDGATMTGIYIPHLPRNGFSSYSCANPCWCQTG
jgi:hypothetical protein